MATIGNFEELKCWQEARAYCQSIYVDLLSNIEVKDYPLKDQINRASDRSYITKQQFDDLANQSITIQKMISGLIKYLNNSEYKGTKFMEDSTPYGIIA